LAAGVLAAPDAEGLLVAGELPETPAAVSPCVVEVAAADFSSMCCL
jgi:hypothetical protein